MLIKYTRAPDCRPELYCATYSRIADLAIDQTPVHIASMEVTVAHHIMGRPLRNPDTQQRIHYFALQDLPSWLDWLKCSQVNWFGFIDTFWRPKTYIDFRVHMTKARRCNTRPNKIFQDGQHRLEFYLSQISHPFAKIEIDGTKDIKHHLAWRFKKPARRVLAFRQMIERHYRLLAKQARSQHSLQCGVDFYPFYKLCDILNFCLEHMNSDIHSYPNTNNEFKAFLLAHFFTAGSQLL